ncbi:hypothetical protein V6N13_033812 [Hibiscus sabdariffa]|uniref:FAS1 domain-containing protein n=1 Tax=Hibiscus sabdariffa TaxID=183260 RepID=A0ABR2F9H8_9ROSI
MSSPAVALFFSLLFLLLAADAANLDISKILSTSSDFSDFDNMLKETGVADEINNKETVTVLAVSNGNLGALSGQTTEVKKMVMSVHVVLDFYDETKLNKSHTNSSKILTTLYQQSGQARNQAGFLNMTNTGNGPVVFSSAAPNSNLVSQLVKEVYTKPYDISVLQVSSLINIASISSATAPSTAPVAAPPPRKILAPASAPTPSADTVADANSPATSLTKPTDASPAAGDAPASTEEKSAVSVTSGDYLASTILMVFTCAWLLLTMI